MHTEQLGCVLRHTLDYCDVLLVTVVIALDRIIVHRHDQEVSLLANL